MWALFGITAIITAILNVVWSVKNREAKWFRFISLSLTALTVCAFYSQAKNWVQHEDWSALMDVVPPVSRGLWFLVTASVLINSVSLFKKRER